MRESDSAHLILPDASATRALGASLAAALRALAAEFFVIFLEGELGAGKTTLVSGLLHELGFVGSVRSPTYTLIETYDLSRLIVHHVDLYRLVSPQELETLGLRDLLGQSGVLLMEWPSKGGDQLPMPDVSIQLFYDSAGERRRAVLNPITSKGGKLLAGFIGVMEQ